MADEAGGLDCNSNVELEELAQGDGAFEEESTVNEDETENMSLSRRNCGEARRMVLSSDDLPINWQHIRHSERQVRHEYYLTVDELMSVSHMSCEQAIAAIVTAGKKMFGLPWKRFE